MSCCRVFRINNDVKKRIIVAFGRYQPPHCGHKTIFDDMISMINDPNNIADEGYIYVMGFPPQPNKRNPLGPNEKLKYLNTMLPNTQIKFIIGNSVGDMLSPETKTLLGDRLIVMPLPTERELAERKELGDKYPYLKVANLYKLHFWFKDRGEENDYMIIAGEDRVSQIKKANKTRKTKFPISEAGQKRSAAAQTGDVCTVDDSPSGSRIRHLALSINSFSLNDPKVQKILSFTKLGGMTDEDVLEMVNDIRKVNQRPEIYNITQEEVMLGGSRRRRKKKTRKKRGAVKFGKNKTTAEIVNQGRKILQTTPQKKKRQIREQQIKLTGQQEFALFINQAKNKMRIAFIKSFGEPPSNMDKKIFTLVYKFLKDKISEEESDLIEDYRAKNNENKRKLVWINNSLRQLRDESIKRKNKIYNTGDDPEVIKKYRPRKKQIKMGPASGLEINTSKYMSPVKGDDNRYPELSLDIRERGKSHKNLFKGGRKKKRRKTKRRKRYKKGGNDGSPATHAPAAETTEEEKTNQERYGPTGPAAGPVRHIVEFSQGKYFNKNVEEGHKLPESQQPCLICHNTEGPLINKGETQLNVRIRKCANCKSLYHRRCLARYFSVRLCDGLEANCPVCKKKWPSEQDVIFLLEEEQARMEAETQQPQPIEQQVQNIEIPVPGNRGLARRFCNFISRRTRAIGQGTFFGTRRRRNTAVVPRGTVMGDYMRRHYGLNTGGPLDPIGGRRKTRKRKNKRKRTRRVKRRRKRRRKKSKKVRRK